MAKHHSPADAGTTTQPTEVDPLPDERRVKLNLAEFCELMGWDRSTVLRKEREGKIPPRRALGGTNVFYTAEVRHWMIHAKISKGSERRAAMARHVNGLGRWRKSKGKGGAHA